MKYVGLALLVAAVVSCTPSVEQKQTDTNNDASATNNQTTSSNNATNNETTGTNNETTNDDTGCEGSAPECVQSCATDHFGSASCVDGRWQCDTSDGWFPVEDCPPGSCFGLPYVGEVCDDGFQCRPDITGALENDCPGTICLTCSGFDPELHGTSDCACECTGEGTVECGPPPTCEVTMSSDIPGVTLRLLGDACEWTLAELAEGVEIDYVIEIDESADEIVVQPSPQDAGGCGQPDASGLIPFFFISNAEDERYCICDVGLCPMVVEPQTLVPGAHEAAIEWNGLQWTGPSDFNNPYGPPFSPGEATVEVSAIGTFHGTGESFRVASQMVITVLE